MVNNAISLVYPSNDLPSHAINDQKLKVVYQGNDLGDKYAISFKKIVQGEELRGNIKLKDKYLWTPLKVKDGNGDETWVKILKSDLKQTFQIEDDELLGVKDIQGLESLIGVHLNKIFDGEKKVSENDGLYRSIVKFFLCHFVVYPTAKRTVLKEIENKTPEQLADIYVKDTESLLATFKGRLQKKHESALEFFGSEMISQIIDEALITEANKQLKKEKQAPWDENKVILLNQLRIVNYFVKNPDEMVNSEKLEKIDLIDIPITKLAEIPVSDKNLGVLKTVWKTVTDDFYAKGKLEDLKHTTDQREITLKAHFAALYVDAYHFMPESIREGLGFRKKEIEKITLFALQESVLDKGVLQEQQKIYLEKIQPKISEAIKKYTASTNISDLLNLFTGIGNRFAIRDITVAISKKLTSEDEKLFFADKGKALIFKEIEKALVTKYNVTSRQLNNLIEYKDAYFKKLDQHDFFVGRMNQANSEAEIFELINFSSMMNSDKKILENILPSSFPKLEEGYATSPLTDLDRIQAVNRLIEARKKLDELQKSYELTESSKLIDEDLKSNEDSVKWFNYKLKLDNEITIGKKYLDEIKSRDEKYVRHNIYFKCGNEHIDKLLDDEQIRKEISTGQNSPLFSPTQQLNLMDLETLLNRSKLNAIKEERKIHSNDPLPSETIRKQISEFLENAKNDTNLIKSLESCIPSIDAKNAKQQLRELPAGISKDTAKFVLEYISRTEKMAQLTKPFDKAVFKAEYLLKKYANDFSSITKDERLSLKELGILSSADRLNSKRYQIESFAQELRNLGLEDINSKVFDFNKQLETAKIIIQQFNEISQKAIDKHYQTGDLFAYNGVKKEKWQDKPSDRTQKLTMFVSNDLMHAGKLHRNNGKIKASHILQKVVNQEFNFYEICISDVWKLDLKPLAPKNMEGYLEDILGKNWGNEINKMHQSIENDLQLKSSRKFGNVVNDEKRRHLAGVANYGSLLKFFNKELQGHERDFDRDFNKLYDKFFNDEKLEEKQICSEFASKITLVSIMKVNRNLSERLLVKLGDTFDLKKIAEKMKNEGNDISQDMKDYADGVRHYRKKTTADNAKDNWKITLDAEKAWKELLNKEGRASSEIDIIMRLTNKEILDLPYSKKEKLRAIHPGRMASLLVEKGCATKRELPPEMQALFNID